MIVKMKKFSVNTPITHCDQVRTAIASAGAGIIGDYAECSFSIRGIGRSKPSSEADPYIGTAGVIEAIEEERIESFCPADKLAEIIKAIKSAHPYEEPAICVSDVEIH